MQDRFIRSKWLLKEKFQLLENAKILVCGCGGVGGACIEVLARSGIGYIQAVDYDIFDISNQNRQIGSENLGEYKAKIFEEKSKNVHSKIIKIDENNISKLNLDDFDIVIDAIDDIKAKILLAQNVSHKLLCSLGAAKRIDTSKITYGSIFNANNKDKFAKKFICELKKLNFNKDFTCVFSTETARCKEMGSCMCVTLSFGALLASLAIRRILNEF